MDYFLIYKIQIKYIDVCGLCDKIIQGMQTLLQGT